MGRGTGAAVQVMQEISLSAICLTPAPPFKWGGELASPFK
jgi:hypothetical protein